MSELPLIKEGDWIEVEGVSSVVSRVREAGHYFGECEVVCSPNKPANRDAKWSNGEWVFTNSNDFGGYAEKYDRLNRFVSILKRGK
ncbi:hypothetical protein [Photobacterium indicum]|uniref:hypothetical protein n=1 Tax=Photobacterium indicum TaxID=81447 RepID=UPI003D14642C